VRKEDFLLLEWEIDFDGMMLVFEEAQLNNGSLILNNVWNVAEEIEQETLAL